MKTTVEISDAHFAKMKELAGKRNLTMRALIESALGQYLALESQQPDQPFKLRNGSFTGEGLQSNLAEGTWPDISRTIYKGRGA